MHEDGGLSNEKCQCLHRAVTVSPSPQGIVPTRESIHIYYQKHIMFLSRDSGLDTIEGHGGTPADTQTAPRTDSLDSHDSISRYVMYSMVVLLSTGMTEVQADGRRASKSEPWGCQPLWAVSLGMAQHIVAAPAPGRE